MVITILAEPRSGSTNLANWFYFNKEFTTLFEPITNSKLKWYKNNDTPKLWEYNTPHLIVKETYYPNIDFSELLNITDKIIILYRENTEEQIDSWTNAKLTKNWENQWVSKNIKDDNETLFFTQLKNNFKEEYLDKNYFKISYEELYYNNGFQKILDYLSMDELENKNFPYGKKYRINVDKGKTFI
jgi:hypothetical protein